MQMQKKIGIKQEKTYDWWYVGTNFIWAEHTLADKRAMQFPLRDHYAFIADFESTWIQARSHEKSCQMSSIKVVNR